jgi:hypothetical protein
VYSRVYIIIYDLTETMEETTMKRNLVIAIGVTALMLATTIAQAADISFSGQFRPRFQINEDANTNTSARENFTTRVRLNAKANVNANTEVFLQFQSTGTWGNATSNRNSAAGSDDETSVGLHQAYAVFKNFMGQAADLKLGRQEVVLDGHRLFGHTGWTDGAQTNDAIRFDHSAGNHELNLIYIEAIEDGGEAINDDRNSGLYILRAATQGVLGGNLSGYFVIADDNNSRHGDNQWYTVGARQKGKLSGLDYRVEFYHQFGDGAVDVNSSEFTGAYTAFNAATTEIDRDAQMFGLRVGKTFKNAKYSPTITLWFDSLTGTDDDNVAGNEMGAFNTLQDTGHKFYGLMDQYTNAAGTGTNYYGLQDIAIKTKFVLSDVNTLKLDFHHFQTHTSLDDGDSNTIRANAGGIWQAARAAGDRAGTNATLDDDLGQEIDVTLVHKYDANTKIVAGYSHYFTTKTHSLVNGSGTDTVGTDADDDQDWMYLMVDTKF